MRGYPPLPAERIVGSTASTEGVSPEVLYGYRKR
jgi:hypothetical protein